MKLKLYKRLIEYIHNITYGKRLSREDLKF